MYDFYLGGKDNYPVDREAARQVLWAGGAGSVLTGTLLSGCG
jgi:hypothetical protein